MLLFSSGIEQLPKIFLTYRDYSRDIRIEPKKHGSFPKCHPLKLYESLPLPRKKDTQYLAITLHKVDAFILQNHLLRIASKNIPHLAEQKQNCL